MDTSEYGILAPSLWQENFKMFELPEIIRERESKEFAEILNRLREGNHTKEDIAKLKQRVIQTDSFNYPLHEGTQVTSTVSISSR